MSKKDIRKNGFTKELLIQKVSEDLNYVIEGKAVKVEIFNFNGNKINISVSDHQKDIIAAFDSSWIRIFDENNKYYDFLTSSIFCVSNSNGVYLVCSEDTEYISLDYITKLISDYMKSKDKEDAIDISKYMDEYVKLIGKELLLANRNLYKIYSIKSQTQKQRMNIEDSYIFAKSKISKKYLLGIITKVLINENKNEIIEVMAGK